MPDIGPRSSIKSEAELIAAILAGESQLFHELIRPYEKSVYLMALSYLKNEAEAEDVAQESIIRAYQHLASFRSESRFSTWLISITLNEARSRLRRQSTVRIESLDTSENDEPPVSPALLRDWREIPSESLERSEVRAMLQEAIEALPTIYRDVFQLREVEEFNVNETASALGISVPAVKVRLHRARLMLQRQLAPRLKSIAAAPKRRWLPWL
jgi:RNA polymerase sigma-70 factor, ECF subfamily